MTGYYETFTASCAACPYKCSSCSSATTCTGCNTVATFRTNVPATMCPCIATYYDSGV